MLVLYIDNYGVPFTLCASLRCSIIFRIANASFGKLTHVKYCTMIVLLKIGEETQIACPF